MNSIEIFQRALKVAPGGVHSPVRSFASVDHPPIVFDWGEGAYIKSVEGDRYIDFCQSFGPNILGHKDPEVKRQVLEVMEKVWTLGALDKYSVDLTEWLVEKIPFIDKLRFVCSGTEAVMSALRVARAYTQREKVLKFEGCYHGHVDNMLVKSGSGVVGLSESSSLGVGQDSVNNTIIGHLDDLEHASKVFAEMGDEIACVILEPLPANYGLLIQRKEFIEGVVALARKHGALVLFDEVISGFRVGFSGMAGELGIEPDIVTYGKVIGGGFPVGAYGARKEIMSMVAPEGGVYQAGTLAANPVGMVAGLATLKKMEEVQLHKNLLSRTRDFVESLQSKIDEASLPWQVITYSSLFWLAPKTDEPIRSPRQFPKVIPENFRPLFKSMIQRGLYMAPNPYEVSFVSWAHTPEILSEASEIIFQSMKDLEATN